MSSTGKELLKRLIPSSKEQLQRLVCQTQRNTLWGQTPVKLRVRSYPKTSGDERISLVRPQLHSVKLYSRILSDFITVRITPEMLRTVESSGGLDDYLLKTPDCRLNSDVASRIRWQLLCTIGESRKNSENMMGSTHES